MLRLTGIYIYIYIYLHEWLSLLSKTDCNYGGLIYHKLIPKSSMYELFAYGL